LKQGDGGLYGSFKPVYTGTEGRAKREPAKTPDEMMMIANYENLAKLGEQPDSPEQ